MALLILTAAATWNLVVGGVVVGQDSATFFYPMYAFLGERLRAGHIPGWFPYQFSGIPFAADPESGWMYLPAMLSFLLPLPTAALTFVIFHLILAGLSTYALARAIGLSVVGALVAAVAFEYSGMLYDRPVCCPPYIQVAAWLPLALLGVELALRRRTWLARAWWWGTAGFALSQVLGGWLGQGSSYALLAIGGYVAYRTLIDPPLPVPLARHRLAGLVLHGGAVLVFGFGLAAAGILPRLEYNALSNVAGGRYQGSMVWAAAIGGLGWMEITTILVTRTGYYVGGATAGLAVMAIPVARRRFATPYFALLSAGALVLAGKDTTLLHTALYRLLPRFEVLHRHAPYRVLMLFYPGPAVLAGALVSSLERWHRRPAVLTFAAVLPILTALLVVSRGVTISRTALAALVFTSFVVATYALIPLPALRELVPAGLLVIVSVDLITAGQGYMVERGPEFGFAKVNLAPYYAPTGAGAFLQARAKDPPFRFFGYDPLIHQPTDPHLALYRYHWSDPRTVALLLNNRGTPLHLQDVQGYNPVQLQRYVEYLTALNGFVQEYHEANIYPSGLASPLLNLLNVRYIVIPATSPTNRPDLTQVLREHITVYQDAQVRVLENRAALPRAWIVHNATQVAPGAALAHLSTGQVDPREVALLEEPPPPLRRPGDPTADQATIVEDEPDRITLRIRTDAPGMLVLSEMYYPAWRPYVDGEPVHLYVADHALQAVSVPIGEHQVELRYQSATLRSGLAISIAAYAALAGLGLAAGWQRWRGRDAGHLAADAPTAAPTRSGQDNGR